MTPVRKNTTDLEAGLQELAELSQHVLVEMQSQRDTLDGLLETMQKTISIEVRADSSVLAHAGHASAMTNFSLRRIPTICLKSSSSV